MTAPYRPYGPDFLTGDEAAGLLDLERSKFQRLVRTKAIEGEHPEGSLRAYFRREVIEHLRELAPDFTKPADVREAYVSARHNASATNK